MRTHYSLTFVSLYLLATNSDKSKVATLLLNNLSKHSVFEDVILERIYNSLFNVARVDTVECERAGPLNIAIADTATPVNNRNVSAK